ncbi:putative kelch domain-containing protein [Rosellinia necatrix]|uniref:Putative kelch domain-containing protein n=1 Tax=Rosellinia necatrix TaxID=77044 RepID=A0A1W2TB65_ROSNE|nr:putative kelch domain-containing protein [Rosellinia necatrix]
MTSSRARHSASDPGGQRPSIERPPFNSQLTSDRIEEGSKFVPFPMTSKIRKGRKSVFRETGLEEDGGQDIGYPVGGQEYGENQSREAARRASEPILQAQGRQNSIGGESTRGKSRWLSKLIPERRPTIKSAATTPPAAMSRIHRFTLVALIIAIAIPTIGYRGGRHKVELGGVDAGVIREPIIRSSLEDRANSPTDVCKRWAGQSAVLNGTLYYYGGRLSRYKRDARALGPASRIPGISLERLRPPIPYGGEFDFPSTNPPPVSTWMYDIASTSWTELQDPRTSAGRYSDAGGAAVQRAAEGAGVSVPELGLSWYFGGHLDWATTPGWSDQVARVYLKSLLEFTHPGYANAQVDSLGHSGAPRPGGAYRNITWAGDQGGDGFAERADAALVYVPGWGPSGVLLGLGGGAVGGNDTTDAFASMATIDVYDIASSRWYHQATSSSSGGDSGSMPRARVNACAVVFSAPDASSFNVYMYGGQDLLPVGRQEQYADVWILTVPSFTWVRVEAAGAAPAARAGHSCAARDGQMVVVGGYGAAGGAACEAPGVYVLDASELAWRPSFAAGGRAPDAEDAGNTVLAGSRGYRVPDAVQSVVGGSSGGGATATQPASGPATAGPFRTGAPPVFTVTATVGGGGGGPTATVTKPGDESGDEDGGIEGDARSGGGTIAAGVVAGLAGLSAFYLGFCAWLWRRQVRAYRRHMDIANGYGGSDFEDEDDDGGGGGELAGAAAAAMGGEKLRKKYPTTPGSGGRNEDGRERFAWVGQLRPSEPGFMTGGGGDEPSPGSGSGSGSGSARAGRPRRSEERRPWRLSYDSFAAGGGGATAAGDIDRSKSSATRSTRSGGSADAFLDGREPNFFSVVLGPRRALRVVNGMEE